jgi:hypothetical protein
MPHGSRKSEPWRRAEIGRTWRFINAPSEVAHETTGVIPSNDALALIGGAWSIQREGRIDTPCTQRLTVSPDRKTVVLQDLADGPPPGAKSEYLVLRVELSRVLTFIDGEKRLTDNGDPVIWWAVFDGNNRFRWRRTDWAPTEVTVGTWVKCPN